MIGSIFSLPRDQLITITVGELLDIINEVTQGIKAEVDQIQVTIATQTEEIVALKSEVASLKAKTGAIEKDMDSLANNDSNQLRLIADLHERDHPDDLGQTVLLRCQKVIRYINNRPDHKAALETLKGVLEVDNDKMSRVIKALNVGWPGRYVLRPIQGDKRKKELIQIKL